PTGCLITRRECSTFLSAVGRQTDATAAGFRRLVLSTRRPPAQPDRRRTPPASRDGTGALGAVPRGTLPCRIPRGPSALRKRVDCPPRRSAHNTHTLHAMG